MPQKKKNLCKNCQIRHSPPTGKKCKHADMENELFSDAAIKEVRPSTSHNDGQLVQQKILDQLQKFSRRLDQMEERIAEDLSSKKSHSKLSKSVLSRDISNKKDKYTSEVSDSSSDESEIPSLQKLRSDALQKRVDKRIRDLSKNSGSPGKENEKRGGIEVKNKVAWPHEVILGGTSRQRLNYDQLSITQWVQGFCRNVLDEKCNKCRKIMISYLSDIMGDATDFSLSSVKASHAVLLWRSLDWENLDRIDRIRRAHAQKHVSHQKTSWQKNENKQHPWFCKFCQNDTCQFSTDHEVGGRIHKHVCAYCLNSGKQLSHPEKDCMQKTTGPKNEQAAAHL